ncbi:MAG: sodium ion-translocating decarboxylase subunit beta [Proteiniphilum sp.]
MGEFFSNIVEVTGFSFVDWGTALMWVISGILLYMGIFKQYEPLLLVPIGFGVLLANLPGAGMAVVESNMVVKPDGSLMNLPEIAANHGIINFLYYSLIKSGILPPVIFMGVGALTDFGPMLRNLKLAFFGGAAQIGIFTVVILAVLMGYSMPEAASMGIIGGADGPTAIYTTIKLAPHMLGPIAIAAYSYMAMVPVIIPAVAKLLMTKEEFGIHMKKMDKLYPPKNEIKHLRAVKIIFPIVLTLVVSVLVPSAAPLIGMLMLGNLLKEIGPNTARLADAAAGPIMNTATVFLGVCVGATMPAEVFLRWETIGILVLGLFAFAISIAGGILIVKLYNKGAKKKINPLVGATGLSAVPMASRVANDMALKYDKSNHILQYCMSSNVSGVIGSAVAAGVLIAFLG